MLTDLIFITVFLLVFLLNYFLFQKRILHPAVLYSFIWVSVIVLHLICKFTVLPGLFDLSVKAYFIFLTGTVSFTAGAFFYQLIYHKTIRNSVAETPGASPLLFHPSFLLRLIFLGIAVVGLPFFLQAAVAAFIKSEAENFLVGVRTELVYGDNGLGPTIYFVGFSFVSYAFCLIAKIGRPSGINKILLWISLLVALVYAIFSTGRTTFLIIIGLYTGLRHVLDPKFKLKIFLWIIPVFAIAFALYGMVFGKGGDYADSVSNNIQASSQNTAVYLVVPLSAFDYEVHQGYEVNGMGNYTLRFFYVAARSFGIITQVPFDAGLINNFVFVPYANNVYTIYSSYMKDFGIGYAFLIVFLFGLLQCWLYTKAVKTKNYKFAIYYAMLLYPLIMSFFADQYIGLFSQWLQFVIYVELFFLLNKIVFISKDGRYRSGKLERRAAAS